MSYVAYALLDRVNEKGKRLVCYKDYRLTSHEFSVLCGESHLSDEIINLLILRYCDRTANERQRMCRFILQPSFLSVGEVSSEVVRKICNVEDMNEVEVMFLPLHMPLQRDRRGDSQHFH